jgi:phage terminase large subunit-like protein
MTTRCARSLRSAFKRLSLPKRKLLLESLESHELQAALDDWNIWARADQLPSKQDYRLWILLGGRGAGKTRAGAEWVSAKARHASEPVRIALVGPTFAEARHVMAEGISGLLNVARDDFRPRYESSKHQITWPDGSMAQLFSAEEPDSLRGPQFHYAWCDELAKWTKPRATWDMLQFALRLGDKPQAVVTTTPRPLPLLTELIQAEGSLLSRSRTAQNAAHLAPDFLAAINAIYGGTRLGRQELEGEILADNPDALFARSLIEAARCTQAPLMKRIVVAVDPPAGSGPTANACGIIAAGLGVDGLVYVLDDFTIKARSPSGWAARAVALYHARKADALIAEANQGGDMVRSVLANIDPSVPVRLVHATRGKHLRAEPVAALYEQGRVKHAGVFASLEDELCDFEQVIAASGASPDRVDALVWAVSELALARPAATPRAYVI